MPGRILSAVDVAAEFRAELALLDDAAADVMLGAWQGVDAALLEGMEQLAASFKPGATLTPARIARLMRYQALYEQVQAQLLAMEQIAAGTLEAGMQQAATLGAAQGVASLDALGVSVGFNRLPVAAVENVVSLARVGRPLAALLEPMYGAAAGGIVRELISGVALGWGPRQIARRMAADGLTDALNHLLLVARDQFNRAHRTAALETYRRSGVVRGYVRRCARQVGRTCIACIALDGQFYTLDVPFEEHPQGRCAMIPAVRDITLSPLGSGRGWFEGLSQEEQIATMGRGRWEAWQAGELSWDDMVQRREHSIWGTSISPISSPYRVMQPISWRPTMSEAEARKWAAQSEYRDMLYHVTNSRNVAMIERDGFSITPDNVSFGRTWGEGVYLSLNRADADDYLEGLGGNGELLNIMVNIHNPLEIDFANKKRAEISAYLAQVHPQWQATFDHIAQTSFGWESTVSRTAASLGYDSLIVTGFDSQMIVFDPHLITVIR